MPREPKTKSKASQKTKQRIAATQVRDNSQTTADTTSTVSDETQTTNNTTTTNASYIDAEAGPADVNVGAGLAPARQRSEPVVWPGVQPSWPSWPTSKPGPRSTPPIPGTRPINTFRPEQYKEVGYNQQTGEPATQSPLRSHPDERTTGPTSFDQPTAQDTVGKHKQRL